MKKTQIDFNKFHSQLDLPFLETNIKLLPEIFEILEHNFGLKRNSKQKLIDLGAGNGNFVIYSALNYEINSYGIEIDQNLINEMKNKIILMRKKGNTRKKLLKKIHVFLGDLYIHDLNLYDFIYIFSLPSIHKYLKHVFDTAKNGATIISHKYPLINFNFILKNEYILPHKDNKQEIFTYFYRKL